MSPIRLNDIYWAAGFLEGEGCFAVTRKQPTVHVAQKTREPLLRLQRIFRHGKITHASKGCWQWRLNSCLAAGVMMTLYPLLSGRRQERIREVLGVWKGARKTPRRPYSYREQWV